MTVETLIHGIIDIKDGRLDPAAIIDMAPKLIDNLMLLIVQHKLQPFVGDDYVYICGKITGLPRAEYVANFKAAEQRLRGAGYKCINPTTIVPETCSWNMAMRLCIMEMMKHCNKIYYLDNWTDNSNGSTIEYMLANGLHFETIQLSGTLNKAV